ncbi:unnamed protein product [Angiostrongylus costaricensis]|uniref:FHA domain-containing protein n=1 Tax=Angiostrongylus costaricensis TaxID=334426 RepID=A0A0R3PKV2_ANGCS|nr:unnamed protein product [Angiostrongylus costaricensis]
MNHVPIANGSRCLSIPKLMVNGRVAMGGQRRVSTAPEPVVIEMSDDFITARTSRDHCRYEYSQTLPKNTLVN